MVVPANRRFLYRVYQPIIRKTGHLHPVSRLSLSFAKTSFLPYVPPKRRSTQENPLQGEEENQNKKDTEKHDQQAIPPQLPLALPDPLLD